MSKKKEYGFSEIEQYREYLEIKSLRGKNIIVSAVFFVLFVLTVVYMALSNDPFSRIFPIGSAYLILLISNFVFTAYGELDNAYLKINKYISTLGMFSIATAMIIIFQSPSMIPLLFIAYCICAIYQDVKVLIISDIYFLFTMLFIVISYPELLSIANPANSNNFSITLFSILFLVMLSISAYIIMKEKSFFHNQISNSKEVEYRNIDLLLKLRKKTKKEDRLQQEYYDRTNEFFKAFSEKLEIPNIFEEKIEILKALEKGTSKEEILKTYPDFKDEDLIRLRKLLIQQRDELNRIAVKIYKSKQTDIKKREIFSSTHFKSFNKQTDTTEIKVLAFVIFYVSLKKGLLGIEQLTNEAIFQTITETDYYYYIDSRVMKIYQENADVFDAIISDAFLQGGKRS